MDSKESRIKSQGKIEDPEEANRSSEQEKPSRKVVKIQNGTVVGERPKLNNNVGETKSLTSQKSSLVISNGARTPRTENLNSQSSGSEEISRVPSNDEASMLDDRVIVENQSNETAILNSSVSNGRSPQCSSGSSRNDKISLVESDIRNNVDYTLTIEKCPAKCSSDSSPDIGTNSWNPTSSYNAETAMNNIGGKIGSTSYGTCCYLRPNINGNRDNGEGTSGGHDERRDSSSGNEGDLSDVEDYCIYTYKGSDEAPVMANSRQSNPLNYEEAAAGQPESGRSSPEMDFLEMDFDPGPSCEQDTGDSDLASINEDIQNLTLDFADNDTPLLNDLSGGHNKARQQLFVTPEVILSNEGREQNVSNDVVEQRSNEIVAASRGLTCTSPQSMPSTSAGLRKWEATSLNRSIRCPLRESYSYHNTSGDLISPGDNRDTEAELWADNSSISVPENSNFNTRKNNLSSTLYHRMMAKKLMLNKQTAFSQSGDSNLELSGTRLDGPLPVEKVMLWSEQEATVKQVTQIGTSACGATSAINALLALDVPFSLEVLVKGVATRLREPGTPLPRYLMSRSLAGATHRDVIRGISLATNGAVITKFFAFYPERNVSLSHWLHHWISRGAAPIATLNLQNCGTGSNIPDAWHHQMIFGASQSGIYMTNPLECLPEQLVWHQLVSPSILLVKRSDVLAHWNPSIDLTPLTRFDQHWRKLNVLGQVVNMIRETMGERKQPTNSQIGASHIRIPASFQAGITLVMRTDAPAAEELLYTEQLPLL